MSTPVNAETFVPALIRDYLESQRTALGFPAALNIIAWPYLGDIERPFLSIECAQVRFEGHPATQTLDIVILLDYAVDGTPAAKETDAQGKTRRDAMLAAENDLLAKMRAALALREGQTITFTDEVISLTDWANTVRTVPNDEDGWGLEDLVIATGGTQIGYNGEKRIRTRTTHYTARIMTNEFTV